MVLKTSVIPYLHRCSRPRCWKTAKLQSHLPKFKSTIFMCEGGLISPEVTSFGQYFSCTKRYFLVYYIFCQGNFLINAKRADQKSIKPDLFCKGPRTPNCATFFTKEMGIFLSKNTFLVLFFARGNPPNSFCRAP